MSSWGARATILLLHLMQRRRVYASEAALLAGIAQTRRAGAAPPPPTSATVEVQATEELGRTVYRLRPTVSAPRARVLYLHGGAYCRPITRFHWSFLGELVQRAGVEVVVPLYPLAPESQGLAAFQFAEALHARVLQDGDLPLVLMGDSAGGGLALALAAAARDRGVAPCDRLMLITPWVDVTVSSPQAETIAPRDPMLALDGVRAAGVLYAGAVGTRHERISPAFGSLAGLPPITMFVGGCDVLGPDAVALAHRAKAEGVSVDLQHAPDMIHVWPLLGFAEARQARTHMLGVFRTLIDAR